MLSDKSATGRRQPSTGFQPRPRLTRPGCQRHVAHWTCAPSQGRFQVSPHRPPGCPQRGEQQVLCPRRCGGTALSCCQEFLEPPTPTWRQVQTPGQPPGPHLLEFLCCSLVDGDVDDDGEDLHPVQGTDAAQPDVQEGVGVLRGTVGRWAKVLGLSSQEGNPHPRGTVGREPRDVLWCPRALALPRVCPFGLSTCEPLGWRENERGRTPWGQKAPSASAGVKVGKGASASGAQLGLALLAPRKLEGSR